MAAYDEAALISELSGADCHIAPPDMKNELVAEPFVQANRSLLMPFEHKFLVLAPVLSATYPIQPVASQLSLDSLAADSTSKTNQAVFVNPIQKERRSSSVESSDFSSPRFLKLGPIHFGGEPGQSDFAEHDDE